MGREAQPSPWPPHTWGENSFRRPPPPPPLTPPITSRALTSLKYSDGVFENASVEFNEEELRPTYRLLMGVPGRSNALNIAARLGLDPLVVEASRERMGADRLDVNDAITRLERLKQKAEADEQECHAIDAKMSRVAIEYRKVRCACACVAVRSPPLPPFRLPLPQEAHAPFHALFPPHSRPPPSPLPLPPHHSNSFRPSLSLPSPPN